MPQSFSSLMEEHLAARSACAIFDVSHMSKLRVRGNGAQKWLEKVLSRKVGECADGCSAHMLLLDDAGHIIDRLVMLRESAGNFLLLGHAGVAPQVKERLSALRQHAAIEVPDETDSWCAVVLMGPQSEQVISRVLRGVELPPPEHFMRFTYQHQSLIISRSGLQQETETERTYEFFCPAVSGISWFESFMGAGAQPGGIATRESLRLERGCAAVGSEITRRSTPEAVKLSHLCGAEKTNADKSAPPHDSIARLRCDAAPAAPPTPGSAVRDTAGNTVGYITSAAFSPDVGEVLAMALLHTSLVQPGIHLVIMVQGHAIPATVL